jgi:hypothetical protein
MGSNVSKERISAIFGPSELQLEGGGTVFIRIVGTPCQTTYSTVSELQYSNISYHRRENLKSWQSSQVYDFCHYIIYTIQHDGSVV